MVRVRLAIVAVCAAGAAAAASVASCAVDPYLTCGAACAEGGSDVAAPDVVTDAPGVDADDGAGFDGFPDAPVCDAAPSCLDAGVPDGWTPIDFATGANLPTCPQGFASTSLVYDAGIASGACHCTACAASGSWTCQTQIGIAGANCTLAKIDASASACINTGNFALTNAEIFPPTRAGNPTCGTSTPNGSEKTTASSARMCTPTTCGESVCGQTSFAACIYASGTLPCPAGYSTSTLAGSGASASCDTCPTCALANADAGCAPSVVLYSQTSCGGTAVQTLTTVGQCNTTSTFRSGLFDAGVPTPTCSYGGGNVSGTAQLSNPITVCCP